MRTFVWSLQVFDALCGYFSVVLGMNNIGDTIWRHVMQRYMNCEADFIIFKILVFARIAVRMLVRIRVCVSVRVSIHMDVNTSEFDNSIQCRI